MAYKAKQEFLWYNAGDEISEEEDQCNCELWLADGLVELVKPERSVKLSPSKKKEEPSPLSPLDVNKDGEVDHKDVLAVAKGALKGSKRRK